MSGIDAFVSSKGNVNINTLDHGKKMKDNAFVEITGHFDNEFNLAGLEHRVGKESIISSLRGAPRLTRWPAEGMIPATPMPCGFEAYQWPHLTTCGGEKAFSFCRNLRQSPIPKSLCVTCL